MNNKFETQLKSKNAESVHACIQFLHSIELEPARVVALNLTDHLKRISTYDEFPEETRTLARDLLQKLPVRKSGCFKLSPKVQQEEKKEMVIKPNKIAQDDPQEVALLKICIRQERDALRQSIYEKLAWHFLLYDNTSRFQKPIECDICNETKTLYALQPCQHYCCIDCSEKLNNTCAMCKQEFRPIPHERRQIAAEVEAAFYYIVAQNNMTIYKQKIRVFLVNIHNECIDRLLKGEITPIQLSKMSEYELAPRALQELRREELFFNTEACKQRSDTLLTVTKMFRCGKCKSDHCGFVQFQTRSSDEPMTTFITCLDCGKKWKQ